MSDLMLTGGLLVVGVTPGVLLFIRNEAVYSYRRRVLARIYELAGQDIAAGRYDWRRWYDAFGRVPYSAMLLRFWRRFDSFFPPELRP